MRRTAMATMSLLDDFILRALAAGVAVAVVAGPLGSFIVWRRMAYFGDTLAHSSLLGITLGFLLGIGFNLAVLTVCAAVALLLAVLQRQRRVATDTLLGILAHSALALGLVAVTFTSGLRLDLMGYLFGDILAITDRDLPWVYGGGALALLGIMAIWRPLLCLTIDEELARVEGVPVVWVSIAQMLLVAVVIAVAMKIVGILLITALLIIPAATARRLAASPEQMALLASLFGSMAVVGGLFASLQWDTPAGPSIVVTAAALFIATNCVPSRTYRPAHMP
jgi:zinc transport system permease protein